jgi:hypothetical protein
MNLEDDVGEIARLRLVEELRRAPRRCPREYCVSDRWPVARAFAALGRGLADAVGAFFAELS